MGDLGSTDTVLASHNRVEPGSIDIPIAKYPASAKSSSIDAATIAGNVVEKVNESLSNKDYDSIANIFIKDGFWRDHLALSWEFHTLKGREKISNFLTKRCRLTKIKIDTSTAVRSPQVCGLDVAGQVKGIQLFITVETDVGTGRGLVRLAEQDSEWKIFTLYTVLQELRGHEEPVNGRRPQGVQHGRDPNRINWQDPILIHGLP